MARLRVGGCVVGLEETSADVGVVLLDGEADSLEVFVVDVSPVKGW